MQNGLSNQIGSVNSVIELIVVHNSVTLSIHRGMVHNLTIAVQLVRSEMGRCAHVTAS